MKRMTGRKLGGELTQPPSYQVCLGGRYKFRWIAKSALSLENIAPNQYVVACGVVAATTTTVYPMFCAAKLHKIRIWMPPSSSAADTLVFNWSQTTAAVLASGPMTEYISNALQGTSGVTGHEILPAPGSRAASWLTAADSAILFVLSCPTGTLVELDLDLCIDIQNENVVAFTGAGLTVGDWYAMGMDALASASSKFTAVGFTQA
jgi:hypothetical protein